MNRSLDPRRQRLEMRETVSRTVIVFAQTRATLETLVAAAKRDLLDQQIIAVCWASRPAQTISA